MDLLLVPDPTSPNGEDAFCREIARRAPSRGHAVNIQAVPNGPIDATVAELFASGFGKGAGLVVVNSLQPAALLAARRAGSLTAVRVIDSYYAVSPHAVDQVRHALLQADGLLVPSRYMADLLVQWGARRETIKEIPYAYDKIMAREIALVNLKAARQAQFPLVVCSPVIEKTRAPLETLLTALSRMRFDWHVSVIGEGPALPALKDRAKELGVTERLTFLGGLPMSEVLEYLRASKAYVDPVGLEGFPALALYALSEGCPVIAATDGAVCELIQDGENGLLFPPGDATALCETLMRLRSETGLSLRLISSGIKTVGRHSWDATVSAFFGAVESLSPA